MKEFEVAWNDAYSNANSFTEKSRPTDMKYIGTVKKPFRQGIREFLFYRDTKNQYWYESRWEGTKK